MSKLQLYLWTFELQKTIKNALQTERSTLSDQAQLYSLLLIKVKIKGN